MERLLRAVADGKEWVDSFTRYGYRRAFERYCALYAADYAAAARDGDPDDLSAALLDALAESWRKLRLWNRAAARSDSKMVVVTYLTPMLLRAEEPCCRQLALALCREWNARWPGDAYCTAPFETIVNGFRHSVLGIDLENKHIDGD